MTKNLDKKLQTTYSGLIKPNSMNLTNNSSRKKLNKSTGGSRSNSVTSGGKSRNFYKTKNQSMIPENK